MEFVFICLAFSPSTIGQAVLLRAARFYSVLWLSHIPLYTRATSSLSTHLLLDTWAASLPWRLQTALQ